MRLKANEITAIIAAARSAFGENAQVWLFGSRTDDSKRGGDIDLYIEADELSLAEQLKFTSLLWPIFGEQKIDAVFYQRGKQRTAFQYYARAVGIELS